MKKLLLIFLLFCCVMIYGQVDTSITQASKQELEIVNQEPSVVGFLKNTWGTLNFCIIASLLFANLLVYVANIFMPLRLKNKEKDIESYKLTILQKNKYIEKLHNQMCNISDNILFTDGKLEQDRRIAGLQRDTAYSGLYLEESTRDLIRKFIDAALNFDMVICSKYREDFETKYRKNETL